VTIELIVKIALAALILSPAGFWLFAKLFPGSVHLTRTADGRWGVHYERD